MEKENTFCPCFCPSSSPNPSEFGIEPTAKRACDPGAARPSLQRTTTSSPEARTRRSFMPSFRSRSDVATS